MHKAKVSIIVPVYNTELYLDQCIDSIVNQTYTNLQIIIVNDGSKDNSGPIISNWANKDDRILLINKENGGLSSARNAGIDVAEGDYIVFVDSDDYVDRNYVKRLLECIKKTDADIAECGFYNVDEYGNVLNSQKPLYIDSGNVHQQFEAYEKTNYLCHKVVWNEIYKRNIYGDRRFEHGKLHEDNFILPEIYLSYPKFSICNENLYFYRANGDSITHSKSIKRTKDFFTGELRRLKLYDEIGEYELMLKVLIHLYGLYCMSVFSGGHSIELEDKGETYLIGRNNIQRQIRFVRKLINGNCKQSVKQRLKNFLAAINIDWYNKLAIWIG